MVGSQRDGDAAGVGGFIHGWMFRQDQGKGFEFTEVLMGEGCDKGGIPTGAKETAHFHIALQVSAVA